MITAITINCTSPLRMWVSSWPSTEFEFGVVERVQQAGGDGDGILLLVQAGGEGVERVASTTFSFGIGMPREMQRFSSRL